jgi:hypothetical protein
MPDRVEPQADPASPAVEILTSKEHFDQTMRYLPIHRPHCPDALVHPVPAPLWPAPPARPLRTFRSADNALNAYTAHPLDLAAT